MNQSVQSKKNITSSIGMLVFSFVSLIGATQSVAAFATVKAVVKEATTLRQLDSDAKTLVLLDELEKTDYKLPVGTQLAFTIDNLRGPAPFESDDNPGQINSMSRGSWQKGIRIDSLPGYSTEVRLAINKKMIFISQGVLGSNLDLEGGQSLGVRSESAGSRHRCYSVIVNKVKSSGSDARG